MTDDGATTLDATGPHSTRVWDYWLGGKDNFAADRAVGDQVRAVFPETVDAARYSRAFLTADAVAGLPSGGCPAMSDGTATSERVTESHRSTTSTAGHRRPTTERHTDG